MVFQDVHGNTELLLEISSLTLHGLGVFPHGRHFLYGPGVLPHGPEAPFMALGYSSTALKLASWIVVSLVVVTVLDS